MAAVAAADAAAAAAAAAGVEEEEETGSPMAGFFQGDCASRSFRLSRVIVLVVTGAAVETGAGAGARAAASGVRSGVASAVGDIGNEVLIGK